jgi:hypothetical protein
MNEQQNNLSGKSDAIMPPVPGRKGRREVVVAALLVTCVAIVGFWEIMAGRNREGFEPFQLTAEDFHDFTPVFEHWSARELKVKSDPVEPNILAYQLDPKNHRLPGMTRPVLVRLVHGYNMRDCMRIKGYDVELLSDTRQIVAGNGTGEPSSVDERASQLQTWKLTSATGDVSIWVTSMIRAYDLAETPVDVRSMAFPRVNVPDAQGWFPRGFTWASLRHPIRNTDRFIRAKWNASRCDLATFLGLRKPAWASEEVLTLVASSLGKSVAEEFIDESTSGVRGAHGNMYRELLSWQANRPDPSLE